MMIEEVLQVLGMPWELYKKMEPGLTVYSSVPQPDPAYAPVEALLALPDMTEEDALNFITERQSQDSTTGVGTTLPNGEVAMARGRGLTYSVLAKATLPNGVWDQVEATIRLGGSTDGLSVTSCCAGGKGFITENTMINVLEEKLLQALGWLKAGPAGTFFRWWIEELRLAMPAAWQQKLQHAMRRVTCTIKQGSLQVGS